MCEEQDMGGPEFYKIVHPNLNTTQQLRIPSAFVRHISQDERGTALLRSLTGNDWKVRFSRTNEGTFFQDGWEDFLRDHSLGNFEVLIFKYNGDMRFGIEIFENTAVKKEYTLVTEKYHEEANISPEREEPEVLAAEHLSVRRGRGRPPKGSAVEYLRREVLRRRTPTEEELRKVMNTAKSFESNRPFFIKPLNRSICLYVPAVFFRTHFSSTKEVVLKNDKGQAWTVNVASNSFCGGWPAFASDNQLKVGDVCIFELVKVGKMNVHIIRC